MSHGFLMALLALDIFVIGVSAYVVWERVQKHLVLQPAVLSGHKFATQPEQPKAKKTQVQTKPQTSMQKTMPEPEVKKPEPVRETVKPKTRNILFQYRDSVPQRVAIIGDFNQWSPRLMKKSSNNRWHITLKIAPGKYAYNFIVDGIIIRDPSNKKSIKANQKIPSSLLIVKSK